MDLETTEAKKLGNILAAGVLVFSIIVLCGWFLKVSWMVQIVPTLAPVQANSALCFIFLSLSLILKKGKGSQKFLLFFPLLVFAVSLLTLIQYLCKVNFGIDTLLVLPFTTVATSHPGRMAPNTATALILMAAAHFMLLKRPKKRCKVAISILALSGGTLGVVALLGYVVGLKETYGWSNYTCMPPQSALCFCLISIATVFATYTRISELRQKRMLLGALSSMVIGLTVTVLLWAYALAMDSKAIETRLQFDAQMRTQILQNSITSHLEALQGITRFFDSSENVTRKEFHSFVATLVAQNRGIVGIDWSPRIAKSERAEIEQSIQKEGFKNFSFLELDSVRKLQKRSTANFYYPVIFTEPELENRLAIGFDHYSELLRQVTMDKAAKENAPMCTEFFRLFRRAGSTVAPFDFLVFSPVFEKPQFGDSKNQNQRKVRGYVTGVFRLSLLVEEALKGVSMSPLKIRFSDSQAVLPSIFAYQYQASLNTLSSSQDISNTNLKNTQEVAVAGRKWTLTFIATEEYIQTFSSWFPWLVLTFGVITTIMASSYILLLQTRNERVNALVEEANRLLAIIDRSPDYIGMSDMDGNLLHHNKGARRMVGLSDDEILNNLKISDMQPEWAAQKVLKEGILAVFNDEVWTGDTAVLHRDGTEIPVSQQLMIHRDSNGTPRYFSTIMRDMTEPRRIEAALAASEKEFKSAFQYASIGMAIVGVDGRWLRVNQPLLNLVGYSEEELLQRTFQDITHPDDLDKNLSLMNQVLDNQIDTYEMEKRYFRKDGQIVWILLSCSLVKDEEGKPRYFITQIQDINERKRVETELQTARAELESRVTERTNDLTVANEALIATARELERAQLNLNAQVEEKTNSLRRASEAERQFRELADAMPQIVWTARPDGFIDYYNKRWYEYTGFREGEGGDESWIPLLDTEEVQKCLDDWHYAVRTGKPYQQEYRFFDRTSGEYRWHLGRAFPMSDESGAVLHWFGTFTDIHDLKQSQDAHRWSEERYRSLLTAASDIIWTNNATGQMEGEQVAWAGFTGQAYEEYQGYGWAVHIHPEDRDRTVSSWEKAVASKSIFEIEHRVRRKDGTYRAFAVKAIPVLESDLSIREWVGAHNDITERKAFEERLHHLNEELEAKVQMRTAELRVARAAAETATTFKSQFLANMSHEIRTPLTSIIGYSESLLTDSLTEGERQFAQETINKNGNHLLGIINDILDLSKIEAGKIEIENMSVDLAELVSDVANLMLHKAHEKGLSFGFDYIAPIPRRIYTDPIRLKQILINLAGNAVKFTAVGGVKVNILYQKEKEKLEFSVVDTGPGISSESQAKLFKAFTQADSSINRKFGGTGLGLVISSQLAEKLGGGIKVESEVGKGSVFTVAISTGSVATDELVRFLELDLGMPQKAPKTVDSPKLPSLTGRVLVAEDGEDNRGLISFLLKKIGVEFQIVENGALAVQAVSNRSFDLVLMDIQMPIMDGYKATQAIRENGISIPIIALTANTMKADIEMAMSVGCSDFLGKPFTRTELFSTLGKYLANASEHVSQKPIVIEETLLAQINEMPEMIEPILAIINNLQKRYDEIICSVRGGDLAKTSLLAHSLRGATANIGLMKLSEVLSIIEEAAIEKDLEAVHDQFDCLKGLIDEAKKLEGQLQLELL